MKNGTLKKLNRKLITASILSTALFTQIQAAPLPNGTLLSIENTPDSTGAPCSADSCFGMEVAPGLNIWTRIEAGTDGGIIVGKNQASGGQELAPSATNSTSGELTAAWYFFANLGTFFIPDGVSNVFDDASCSGINCIGVTELNSFNVAWDGVNVPMGSGTPCSSPSCSAAELAGDFINDYTIGAPGEPWSINFHNVVPDGDPSNFGNIKFSLILKGTVYAPGPYAKFIMPTYIVIDKPVQFTDTSTITGDESSSIVDWQWDFGDGNTSTEQNPLHTYALAGNYTVTLTIKDDIGNSNALSQVVSVGPASIELSTLDGTNGFKLNGEAPGDNSGSSVSAAGDINGDGLDDFIIGVGLTTSTRYVVFGSTQGFAAQFELSSLNGTNGFKLNGFGRSVSSAGDINGDGIDDIIIGAPFADTNDTDTDAGASFVVFGSTQGFSAQLELSSLDGANGFRLNGVTAFDNSGTSVSAAGDINGDGLDDLIIGAYRADINGSNSGASYVVFGSTQGFSAQLELSSLNGSNGFRLNGEASEDYSGSSVSAAGDINGDGIDDLIIGAPRASASYVVFGNTQGFPAQLELSSLNGSNGFKVNGETTGDYSGGSVSAAGDINGDSLDDLIIGASSADTNDIDSGASYVVFGNTQGFPAQLELSSLNGSNGFKVNGETTGDYSGVSVSAAGDINGDSLDDLIIGASSADTNDIDSGASYVVFGNTQGFPAQLELLSLDGSNGFRLSGEAGGDRSGSSVSAAGDINGDGLDDLIIGARLADPNGSNSGASYVVFGQASPPPCTEPSVATITTVPQSGIVELGEAITFVGGYRPCDSASSFSWRENGLEFSTNVTTSKTFTGLPDIHTIELSVINTIGLLDTVFTDIKAGPPHVNGFWPGAANPGARTFIFGENFITATGGFPTVCFDTNCSFLTQVLSDDLMLTIVPTGVTVPTSIPLHVNTDVATGTSLTNWGEISPTISINGIWPAKASVGTIVFVFGSKFDPTLGGTQVTINGVPNFLTQVQDETLLLTILPAGATSGPVCVTAFGQTTCGALDLEIMP